MTKSKSTIHITVDTWAGCYTHGWNGLIHIDTYAHPAKYARGLIQRIYQHLTAEGWLPPGGVILDPFGGVALGGHDAGLSGVRWVGIELEDRFVQLGRHNLALWQRRYGHLPQWVTPVCLQGDARRLREVVAGAECVVSSPPYSPEALGHCKAHHLSNDIGRQAKIANRAKLSKSDLAGRDDGTDPAQLGNLRPGSVEAVVSSPPYEQSLQSGSEASKWALLEACHRDGNGHTVGRYERSVGKDYGRHPDQLGNTQGTTFWSAAKTILEQVFTVLKPGGHAVWTVKSYCRDGAIVDFPGQWLRLCQHVGFQALHEHHALLSEDHGTQGGLFGEDTQYRTKRVSFFRRLHEAKRPDLAIEWETVYCMVKPGTGAGIIDCVSSSPPYNLPMSQDHNGSRGGQRGTSPSERGAFVRYGHTPGQLEGMPPGSVDGVVSSPPYAGRGEVLGTHNGIDYSKITNGGTARTAAREASGLGYGHTPGQLGAMPEGPSPSEEAPCIAPMTPLSSPSTRRSAGCNRAARAI